MNKTDGLNASSLSALGGSGLDMLMDLSADAVCLLDREGVFLRVSVAAEAVLGCRAGVLTGRPFLERVLEEDQDISRRFLQEGLMGTIMRGFEHRYRAEDGGVRLISWSASYSEPHALLYCTARDVTSSRIHLASVKSAYKQMEGIVGCLAEECFHLNHEWVITYWNGQVGLPSGRHGSEMIGKNFWSLFPRARQSRYYGEFLRAVAEKVPVHFEAKELEGKRQQEVFAFPSGEGLSVYLKSGAEHQLKPKQGRRPDQQLRQANSRLQDVLENMSDGFFTMDRNWIITFATDRMAAMVGIKKEDYIGKNYWDCFPASAHNHFYSEYCRALEENRLVSFEEWSHAFSLWVEVNVYPIGNGLSVYIRDITERKRQERELQISIERFHFVSMATSDVIWDWDVQTGSLYINQSFTRVFGYGLEEGVSASEIWKRGLHPEDRERVITTQAAAIADKSVFLWEDSYRFFRKGGELAYVTDRAVILRNEEGKALRLVGAVQDTTESKRQQQRLEFMARATSEVIWERRLDSEVVQVSSEKLRQLFGHETKNNRIDRNLWLSHIHPDDAQVPVENRLYALRHGLDFYLNEYRFRRRDGNWAWVKNRVHILRGEDGRPQTLIGAIEDITRERQAEQALVKSERNYRLLFNHAPLPMAIYDRETLRILDVNNTAVQHYGYSREELLKLTIWDIRPPEEHPRLAAVLAEPESSNTRHLGTFIHLKKSGERIQVEVSVTSVQYRGRMARLVSMHDITEKMRLQKHLLEQTINQQKHITKAAIEAQEKERSEIGRELHDGVNQVLTSAKLYVENIRYYPEQRDHFIEKGTALLQQSINEIRRLSRALVTPALREVSFRDTLGELVNSYRELLLFEVSFSYGAVVIENRELRLTLYRILQEAFSNTVKYAGASLVQVSVSGKGGQVLLVYSDNGSGFDPSTVKRGLGLNNIKNRAEAYGGQVLMTSSPGRGWRLEVTFPLQEALSPFSVPSTNKNNEQ